MSEEKNADRASAALPDEVMADLLSLVSDMHEGPGVPASAEVLIDLCSESDASNGEDDVQVVEDKAPQHSGSSSAASKRTKATGEPSSGTSTKAGTSSTPSTSEKSGKNGKYGKAKTRGKTGKAKTSGKTGKTDALAAQANVAVPTADVGDATSHVRDGELPAAAPIALAEPIDGLALDALWGESRAAFGRRLEPKSRVKRITKRLSRWLGRNWAFVVAGLFMVVGLLLIFAVIAK